ncbi:PD-(D/E)XK nuclease family protein [Streptomyces sp. NPDC005955]|uniref:PD-(D/E)XK nuclease family protein n=1 Tax=Streptomyces sp. NPDC005955 TaxID=3364738 RepID=UPI0036C4D9CF
MSQVEQYEKCPKQYELQRVLGVRQRPAAWFHQGTAVHAAVEEYEVSGRALDASEAVAVFSENYSRGVRADLAAEPNLDRWMTAGGAAGRSDIESRYALGMDQTRAYVEWAEEHQPSIWKGEGGELGIEKHLTAEIGGVTVQGYVDQLVNQPDNSVRVRDVKTGTTRSAFQLQTYTVLVRKALSLKVNDADWYMAKNGKLSRPIDLKEVAEADIAHRFVEADHGINAGSFPARPGFHCRFCSVSHACNAEKKRPLRK